MFAPRYFAERYFTKRYWPPGSGVAGDVHYGVIVVEGRDRFAGFTPKAEREVFITADARTVVLAAAQVNRRGSLTSSDPRIASVAAQDGRRATIVTTGRNVSVQPETPRRGRLAASDGRQAAFSSTGRRSMVSPSGRRGTVTENT